MDMMLKLTAIKTTDRSWEFAGFGKHASIISLQDVDIIFPKEDEEQNAPGSLIALGFEKLPSPETKMIAGIPVFEWKKLPATISAANTVISVDHVVIHTTAANLPKFKQDMEACGIKLRRERNDIYPGVTQLFYRTGTVLEVVIMPSVEHTHLWGLTLVVQDLDRAKQILNEGNYASTQPKNAVQRGRRIMTLKPPPGVTKTNMAFMTPHVPAAAAKL